MSDTLPDYPRPARTLPDPEVRRRGCGTYILGALALLALLAGVGGYLVVNDAKALVVEQAKLRHITLRPDAVQLGLTQITIHRATFTLAGVSGLAGEATELSIEHAWLSPKAVTARGLTIDVASTDALREVAAWATREGSASLPMEAPSASLRYVPKPGAAPTATLTGDLSLGAMGGKLRAASLQIMGRSLKVDDAHVALEGGKVTLDLGPKAAPAPPNLRAIFDTTASPVTVEATLAPRSTSELAGALSAVTKLDATIAGTLRSTLPLDDGEPLVGSVELSLTGFVPPHIKELDGIVFGDKTAVSAKFWAKTASDIELSDVRIAAGALSLGGSGSVSARADGAKVRLDVSGAVPCSQLATSAASSSLGPVLGALAGNLARQRLAGDVFVRLFVDLDTTDPKAAKIDPSAVVRCSVKL